ncbi:HAD-IC family P-type ATPase [Oxalobacter vibrioformis]|uniref:HAD-IC family P-type ATPase n=1 Tax=Oxalobacter vibrioformis TaxID=933080 RepID=A0A9E9LZL8_9BURK|nr:HAD-IC family P-type ATPase [Oxalobacter vibrioformis]WAW10143.1 HAD-IC family P-type ATPase [Oxalobacter vibrioformis]
MSTELKLTDYATGLTQAEAEKMLKEFGPNEVVEEKKNVFELLLEKFWGPIPWVLGTVIIISVFQERMADTLIIFGLLIFCALVDFLRDYSIRRTVKTLHGQLQDLVSVLRDSKWVKKPYRDLVSGDVIRLKTGSVVPADVLVIEGLARVNESILTGDVREVIKHPKENIYSGSVITRGWVSAVVGSTGKRMLYHKTIEELISAKKVSLLDEIAVKLEKWPMFTSFFILTIAVIVSWIRGISLFEILPLMLVLLLGSVPLALSAVFSLSMAITSRRLAGSCALVTRLDAPNDAACMDILLLNKTGTLTVNHPNIVRIIPAGAFTDYDVIQYGAMTSDEVNENPIDDAFFKRASEMDLMPLSITPTTFLPFNPQTRKAKATIVTDDVQYRLSKGSFEAVARDCGMGPEELERWRRIVANFARDGFRTIAVAKSDFTGKMELVGLAGLEDVTRTDTAEQISKLVALGIRLKLITGEALPIAQRVARAIGLGSNIIDVTALVKSDNWVELLETCDGVANVYPEDKIWMIKALQERRHIIGFTGDAVTDAPALRQADVGIAIKSATNFAKSAASIVLTRDGLGGIVSAVNGGRNVFECLNAWILSKMGGITFKTGFIILSFLILGDYIITAAATLILMFLSDYVKTALATDHENAPPHPDHWHIRKQAFTGVFMGLILIGEAGGLLYFGWDYFNLDASDGTLNTFSFLLMLFFTVFFVFSVRERGFFWRSRPSWPLFLVFLITLSFGLVISIAGLLGFTAISLNHALLIMAYTFVVTFFINDFIKYLIARE